MEKLWPFPLEVYSFGREILDNRQYCVVENEAHSSRIECTPYTWGCLFFALLDGKIN